DRVGWSGEDDKQEQLSNVYWGRTYPHLLIQKQNNNWNIILRVRLVRGTERDEAFRPAFGAPKMGETSCSTRQILGVFASHLPPGTGCSTGLLYSVWIMGTKKLQADVVRRSQS
ncbi:hypothetical protein DVH24_032652, partial [Malus domestica]